MGHFQSKWRRTLAKWRLKGCPHCGGDLAHEQDMDIGTMWKCLLCSREWLPARLKLLEDKRNQLESERLLFPPE